MWVSRSPHKRLVEKFHLPQNFRLRASTPLQCRSSTDRHRNGQVAEERFGACSTRHDTRVAPASNQVPKGSRYFRCPDYKSRGVHHGSRSPRERIEKGSVRDYERIQLQQVSGQTMSPGNHILLLSLIQTTHRFPHQPSSSSRFYPRDSPEYPTAPHHARYERLADFWDVFHPKR